MIKIKLVAFFPEAGANLHQCLSSFAFHFVCTISDSLTATANAQMTIFCAAMHETHSTIHTCILSLPT
ncbi:hypothetical protein DUQ00_11585 [Salmonella bongori]|uniref:Uncharacterized protein n=2 Tax=Salmonella TaxID=590 RepID=A0A750P1D3_SALER|nr:hypothetical protein [Salmonella bongori]EGE4653214.1 hypothetical protein [Salmonella bongori serovar 40:z35:- str. 95-0123]EGE4659810.1 hypothetical protein [Salmonella bongori serovar 48:i:- str. 94-0708]EGS1128056.1 hypothetical protein [Salmonella bongori CFSAN000509]HAC6693529.1 hypothetical protein [Salmonella bongori serovar 44:r:-]